MKPLDEYIDVINTKFPKYIPIAETECNCMPGDGVLFKKQYYNEYCYLGIDKGSCTVTLTLFKCDWSSFDKIETEFLEGFNFAVRDKNDAFIIINSIV